jgi:hypothetical protein
MNKLLPLFLIVGGAILIISGIKDTTPGVTLKALLTTGMLPKTEPTTPSYTPTPAGRPPAYTPTPAGRSRVA